MLLDKLLHMISESKNQSEALEAATTFLSENSEALADNVMENNALLKNIIESNREGREPEKDS